MNLIDTHAHLDQVENISLALEEAAAAGVVGILAVSTDLAAMKKNLEIKRGTSNDPFGRGTNSRHCEESPQGDEAISTRINADRDCFPPRPFGARGRNDNFLKIYLGLGIHPGDIKVEELEESYQFIRDNISDADVVGEIGLDFWYKDVRKDDIKKNEQREVFRRQLQIAEEFDKPVVVHSRGTWRECFEMVKKVGIKKANFHWYSGPLDVLEDIIKSGYYISSGPALAHSVQSREAISHAPIEQTLIETDSPVFYNYPEELGGGFKSGPKDVFKALTAYAQLKEIAKEDAAEILNKNAREFII